jgi:hypothetical protein
MLHDELSLLQDLLLLVIELGDALDALQRDKIYDGFFINYLVWWSDKVIVPF